MWRLLLFVLLPCALGQLCTNISNYDDCVYARAADLSYACKWCDDFCADRSTGCNQTSSPDNLDNGELIVLVATFSFVYCFIATWFCSVVVIAIWWAVRTTRHEGKHAHAVHDVQPSEPCVV